MRLWCQTRSFLRWLSSSYCAIIAPIRQLGEGGIYAGEENSLTRALSQMKSPSILVAYLDYVGVPVHERALGIIQFSRRKNG